MPCARTLSLTLFVALIGGLSTASVTVAAEAPPSNEVRWADGRIEGHLVEAQGTGGITGNYWPDLAHFKSIGQSFRCEGPTLAAIQLGLADADIGYRGLTYRTHGPAVTIRLRRGGPSGDVVAERTYTAADVRPDLLLHADVPSTPEDLWYVEVSAEPHTAAPEKENTLNANWHDTYPDGYLHLNGRPAEGDLHLRIHTRRPIQATRPGPVTLWAASPQTRVWLEPERTLNSMLADNPDEPIRLSAAGREWSSTQLVLSPQPGYAVERAKLEVGALRGPGGATLGPEHFRFETLRYLEGHHNGNTSRVLYPDPLAPDAEFVARDVPNHARGSNLTFVYSVWVPEHTPAGIYRGDATAVINSELKISRPIELRVYGFSLPKETNTRTGLFSSLAGKTLEEHVALVRDLASFRIALGYPFQWDHNQILRRNGFSEDAYRDALGPVMQESLVRTGEIFEEQGLASATVTPWGDIYRLFRGDDPQAAREGIVRFWQTYYPILESHGWLDRFHARMVDEVKGDEIRRTHEAADLFREHAPGLRIMVTAMGTPDVTQLAKAVGLADIWCPSSRYMARAMDFYQARMRLGEQVWPYIHDHAFLATDQAGPRLFFWMLHQYGFQGVCYFSVSRARVVHTWYGVEQHTDVWAGDGDLYYPSPEGEAFRWRSLRLHLIRDGMEDREYFLLLDRLVRQAADRDLLTPSLREEAAKAAGWLDRLSWSVTSFSTDAGQVEAARDDLAEAIEKLQQVLGKQGD